MNLPSINKKTGLILYGEYKLIPFLVDFYLEISKIKLLLVSERSLNILISSAA